MCSQRQGAFPEAIHLRQTAALGGSLKCDVNLTEDGRGRAGKGEGAGLALQRRSTFLGLVLPTRPEGTF